MAKTRKPRHPAKKQDWARLLKVLTEAGGLSDVLLSQFPYHLYLSHVYCLFY